MVTYPEYPERIAVKISIWGYPIGEFLAITKNVNDRDQWNITHIPTGRTIGSESHGKRSFFYLDNAMKTARVLAELDIWDKLSEYENAQVHTVTKEMIIEKSSDEALKVDKIMSDAIGADIEQAVEAGL